MNLSVGGPASYKIVSPRDDRVLDRKSLQSHLLPSRNVSEASWSPVLSSIPVLPMSFDLQRWSRSDLGADEASLRRPR